MDVVRQLPLFVWFVALVINAVCIGIFAGVEDYSMVIWHIAMGSLCYWGYRRAQSRKKED